MGLINQYFKSEAHYFKRIDGGFIGIYLGLYPFSCLQPSLSVHTQDPHEWYGSPLEPCTKDDFDSAANQLIEFLKGGEVA